MSIRKRQTTHGTRYDVTVYVDSNKRQTKTVRTKVEAIALEAALIAERDAQNARGGSMRLESYISKYYWPVAVKRLSATSCDTYEQEIRLRILPSLGKLPLREIDRAAIQVLMVDKCATSGVARSAIGVLKTILNEAVHDGYITRNYACSKFALPSTPSRARDNGLVLSTFAEIHEMLLIVDTGSECVQKLAYTGLLLGLRPEERYALDWSCFDLDAQTVAITSARITASSKHGGVQNKTTKTPKSRRTVPMHPDFHSWLLSQPPGSGAFILDKHGGQISPSTARKRWSSFLSTHKDCPPVTLENMRHSYATAYLAAGGQIEVLSRILGHTNINTTINKYYRPDIGVLSADVARIAHGSRKTAHFPTSAVSHRSSILRASTNDG